MTAFDFLPENFQEKYQFIIRVTQRGEKNVCQEINIGKARKADHHKRRE